MTFEAAVFLFVIIIFIAIGFAFDVHRHRQQIADDEFHERQLRRELDAYKKEYPDS